MKKTCQSDIGPLQSVFIKRPAQAFIDDHHLESNWEKLNFLGKPDLERSITEYDLFESAIKASVSEVFYLPEDSAVNMDSIYCRDASIATDSGMILCKMGKAARSGEPGAEGRAFVANGFSILGEIIAPGTVEGGDVVWLDQHTLAVGLTYRTNAAGIAQLRGLLSPLGIDIIEVQLPHYKGPDDVFHLMSILSPIDTNLAVVYSPLMPIVFRNILLDRGYELVEVPTQEFDSMGCNVLALSPRNCLMVEGNPITENSLKAAGCRVTTYKGTEISVKGGGGPTCLTRPLWRTMP